MCIGVLKCGCVMGVYTSDCIRVCITESEGHAGVYDLRVWMCAGIKLVPILSCRCVCN